MGSSEPPSIPTLKLLWSKIFRDHRTPFENFLPIMISRNFALYFSRAPIPWDLNTFQEKSSIDLNNNYFQHIGLYGYRASFLKNHMDTSRSLLGRFFFV